MEDNKQDGEKVSNDLVNATTIEISNQYLFRYKPNNCQNFIYAQR